MNIVKGVFRRTKLEGWYEFMKQTCPICNKTGGCIIHESGEKVACIRVPSEIQFGKGALPSWLHFIKDGVKVDVSTSYKVAPTRSKLPDQMLHHIYSAMMKHDLTALTREHMNHLTSRGISKETIDVRGYCSFPEKPWIVAKEIIPEQLANRLEDPKFPMGIPGFYKNQYGWTIAGNEGILIPYRNEHNWIVGFQIRIDHPKNDVEVNSINFPGLMARVKEQPNLVQVFDDEGEVILERHFELNEQIEIKKNGKVGTVRLKKGQRYFWLSSANKKCGASAGEPIPVHVAVPTQRLKAWNSAVEKDLKNNSSDIHTTLKAENVWITEGALKADIAVDHIAKAFNEEIKEVGDTFLAVPGANSWRSLIPVLDNMGVKRVNIAFDMDAIFNEHVKMHFKNMVAELKNKYDVFVALWNPKNKGIDDLLTRGIKPQLRKI